MTAAGWNDSRRVLCVRLDGMGDVLMTTPAIAAVRAARPDAHVALLASPAGAAIARMIPDVDEVVTYEAPWMKAGAAHAAEADRAMVDRLRDGAFDAAIIFTVFSQSALPAALMCRLAGIPLALAHVRERSYRLLSNAVAETEPAGGIRHEVQRQLDLVATRGWHTPDPRLRLAPPAMPRDARLPRDDAWVLVHPGATAPSRRYPPALLARALERMSACGLTPVLAGGREDRETLDMLRRACPDAIHLGCELSLGELVAVIAGAPVLVANNSGPMHIAAACGTPVVALYAGTNPQHTPWQVPARVLARAVACAPCFGSICAREDHACLAGVAPEEVAAAACALHPARRLAA